MLNNGKPILWDPSDSDLIPHPTMNEVKDQKNGCIGNSDRLTFHVFFEVQGCREHFQNFGKVKVCIIKVQHFTLHEPIMMKCEPPIVHLLNPTRVKREEGEEY